ncbi:MAG: YlmC/YmxH family sporulation protein [Clostridia bacterium]|nr:YlmC/YmxH family sporulation protein [Clostridia bacterium]MBO4539926.1 YlmC/YmxH family sporulation protein [Clostridia bacterium]
MKEFTFCELREKEVINVADGKKLGRVFDASFSCGKITGLMVPGDKKFFKSVTGSESIFIPWPSVLKIGGDVILVVLNNRTPPGIEGKI